VLRTENPQTNKTGSYFDIKSGGKKYAVGARQRDRRSQRHTTTVDYSTQQKLDKVEGSPTDCPAQTKKGTQLVESEVRGEKGKGALPRKGRGRSPNKDKSAGSWNTPLVNL